jgi:hypothetical protein
MTKCDQDLYDDFKKNSSKTFEQARAMTPMTLKFSSSEYTIHTSLLCSAEFCIGQGEMSVNDTDGMEHAFRDLLSTHTFDVRTRFIRFIIPARPDPQFSMIVHRAIERYGAKNVFIIVTTTPGNLDKRVLSRLAHFRVPSPKFSAETDKNLISFLNKRANSTTAHKSFDDAHISSYKLCGSLVSVTDLAHAIVKKHDYDPKVIQRVAAIEALRYKTNKISLLFDLLLFEPFSKKSFTKKQLF